MTEREELAALDRLARRYLSRRVCWLCEYRLDRAGCGAIWEPCSAEVRARRRAACLKSYRRAARRPRREAKPVVYFPGE
jgi:hypothetical protein